MNLNKSLSGVNYTQCFVCESEKLIRKYKINRYIVTECLECSFKFINNKIKKEELLKYYKYKDYENVIETEKIIRKDAVLSLKTIESLFYGTKELLDIGCGRGYFMDEARKRGWIVEGVDYSYSAVKYAEKKLGLNVLKRDIFKINNNKKHNLVVANQFIEHFSNPNEFIHVTKNLLKDNGFLYIATPNFSSYAEKYSGAKFEYYIPPEHLSMFNIPSLIYLLKINNYKILKINTWSYKSEFAGIIKNIIKNVSIENEIAYKKEYEKFENVNIHNSLLKKIKFKLFDDFFCGSLHGLLDLVNKGSIIEVFAQKEK